MYYSCIFKNNTIAVLYYRIIWSNFYTCRYIKYMFSDFPYTIWYSYIRNTTAASKCIIAYACHAIWYINFFKALAIRECIPFYPCNTIGNLNICKHVYFTERTTAYNFHASIIGYYAFSASGYQSTSHVNNTVS